MWHTLGACAPSIDASAERFKKPKTALALNQRLIERVSALLHLYEASQNKASAEAFAGLWRLPLGKRYPSRKRSFGTPL
jgi:hypothetical protein